MQIVLDIDDFTDNKYYKIVPLIYLKKLIPGLKVTLFCIPKNLSDKMAKDILSYGFFELAQHGWVHNRYECKNLLYHEAVKMLDIGKRDYFVNGFKAPHWICSHAMFKVLRERGYWVAVHEKQKELADKLGVRAYLHNHNISKPWVGVNIRATGHVSDGNCKDGISECWYNLLKLPRNAEYKFISEVMK